MTFRSFPTVAGNLLTILCLVNSFPSALRGQSTFGSIARTIQDASDSAVADAIITITNLNENTGRTTASGASGSYQLLNLRPGTYQLTVTKAGFNDAKSASLKLDARQQLRVDLRLELASVSTSVSVSETAAIINTENGTIGDTRKLNQVVQLPMKYRGGNDSPLAALVAVPGVQQDASGNVSIGGGTPAQIQYSVDGTSTVNVRQNGAPGNMNPSSELISEMKVTQFNNNAEFSQLADVTIITKSGTNALRLRFEATFTNLPNHPNFAPPPADVSAPATFGKITTVQSAENSGNRTGQIALRLDF